MPPPASSLPDQLQSYRAAFLDLKASAQALVQDVDDDILNERPAPNVWTVAQVFDHVNTAGWLLLARLEEAFQHAQTDGPFGEPPFRYGFMSRWFVDVLQPSSRWSFPAPPVFEPASPETLHPREAVREFLVLQDDLAACVELAHGLDLRRIRVGSPAFPLFRISAGAWFEATAAHQRRHLAQARDVLRTLGLHIPS